MPELFPLAEVSQKSPRLLWMEENDFHTKYRRDLGNDVNKWEAYVGDYGPAIYNALHGGRDPDISPLLAIGRTEAQALRNLCDNRGIDYLD